MTSDFEHLFMCYLPFVYFLLLHVFSNLLPIFYWIVCFLIVQFWEFLKYSRYKSFLLNICFVKIFFPVCVLSSHSLKWLLKCRSFIFWCSSVHPFVLLWIVLLVAYLRATCLANTKIFLCFLPEVLLFHILHLSLWFSSFFLFFGRTAWHVGS